MPITYAIGDIHGRSDLLDALLEAIRVDAAKRGARMRIVFLGDVIDRGPHSRQAMDRVIETLETLPGSALILGNHEEFLLRFLDDAVHRETVARHWFANGGLATIASYGFSERDSIDAIAEGLCAEFPSHIAALRAADWSIETDSHVFVHGGIDTALPLDRQDPVTTRWIRHEFLEFRGPLEKIVVHGHTPTDSFLPEVHGNRIAVDTGAFGSGHLTCAVLANGAPPRFLATDDSGRRIATGEVRPLDFRK